MITQEYSMLSTYANGNNVFSRYMSNEDKLQIIHDKIDSLKDNIDGLKDEVSDLNDHILDPDKGLYSRIKDLEVKVNTSSSKINYAERALFTLVGAMTTGLVGIVIKLIFGV